MILNMGIFLGIWNLLGMLMLAFLVAAMAAGAGLWSGKWETDDKNVVLSFSFDRLSGDIYMVKLKEVP